MIDNKNPQENSNVESRLEKEHRYKEPKDIFYFYFSGSNGKTLLKYHIHFRENRNTVIQEMLSLESIMNNDLSDTVFLSAYADFTKRKIIYETSQDIKIFKDEHDLHKYYNWLRKVVNPGIKEENLAIRDLIKISTQYAKYNNKVIRK